MAVGAIKMCDGICADSKLPLFKKGQKWIGENMVSILSIIHFFIGYTSLTQCHTVICMNTPTY